MRRRDLLAGLGGSLLTACATPGKLPGSEAPPEPVLTPVPPVLVHRDRILKTVVGLRPYRSGGFKLSSEPFADKHLVHNYGHGGDGVSLSWGCAQVAAELAHARPEGDIAILGSGVMGLTTALILASWGRRVTVYAEDFPPNTTSNIAGALILVPDSTEPRIARLSHDGWEPYVGRAGYGVKRIDHRFLGQAGSDVTASGFLGRRVRQRQPTVMVDPGIYLKQIMADARARGVTFYSKRFETTPEVLALPEPIIVNCTGLGAGNLFLDSAVKPMRGQLTLLQPQPEIDYAYIARGPERSSLYMFPRETSIVLGGTRDLGDYSREVDPATVVYMLKAHAELASWASGRAAASV